MHPDEAHVWMAEHRAGVYDDHDDDEHDEHDEHDEDDWWPAYELD